MKPNVICALCKSPMYYDKRISEYKFSHGMCKNCKRAMLNEDWMFQPQPGGNTVVLDPHYSMSNLKKVDKKDDAMPDYHYTQDAGMDTTQRQLNLYNKMNSKNNVMRNIPMGT